MPKPSTLLDVVFNAKVEDTCKRVAGGTRMPRTERTLHLWTPIMPVESAKTEPPITGIMVQSDEGGEIPADRAH